MSVAKTTTRAALIALVLGLFSLYILPALILRPNMHFGQLPQELKDLIWKTAYEMDGGVYVNGSGVRGPRIFEAAAKLTAEDVAQYKRDGYIIIRNAVPSEQFVALEGMYSHIQNHPNLLTRAMDTFSCQSNVFGADRVVPEFAALMFRLNLHWIAQKLLETKELILMNSILHYNLGSCKQRGSILSTHNDYFTLPFSVEKRRDDPLGFWGDNGLVGWIAIDEISPQAVTMQIGKGSHLRYTNAYPNASRYHQHDYCPLMWEDLAKEDKKDEAFAQTFFELPVLHPGDAVFFNGFTYHRPILYCKAGCGRSKSRRMTVRYIDGERTRYRDDVPTLANHHQARWCPALPFRLLGEECRVKAGMKTLDHADLPLVISLSKGGRRIPTDGGPERYMELEPWSYFIGMGHRVHHDTCMLEAAYVEKFVRRTLHSVAPSFQMLLWGEIPRPRPGEEEVYLP